MHITYIYIIIYKGLWMAMFSAWAVASWCGCSRAGSPWAISNISVRPQLGPATAAISQLFVLNCCSSPSYCGESGTTGTSSSSSPALSCCQSCHSGSNWRPLVRNRHPPGPTSTDLDVKFKLIREIFGLVSLHSKPVFTSRVQAK